MTANTQWTIDPLHSEIGFKVKHMMISNINGVFREYGANINTAGNDFTTAEIDFWLKTASVNTGYENRDTHLISADFFDSVDYPQINFISNTIEKTNEPNHYVLWGDLTIKGISCRIKLDLVYGGIVQDLQGKQKAGFTVSGKINRSDFGLIWNTLLESGGVMLSEEVKINCDVELSKVYSTLPLEAEIHSPAENKTVLESAIY